MKSPTARSAYRLAVIAIVAFLQTLPALGREHMATLREPGTAEIRDEEDRVVATVRAGEKFMVVNPHEETDSCTVFLKSGITGTMDLSKVREVRGEPLMRLNYEPAKEKWRKAASLPIADEAGMAAKQRGVDYYPTLLRASEGDRTALAAFFGFSEFMDGGAAEGYSGHAWELLHVAGDAKFAAVLRGQSSEIRDLLKGARDRRVAAHRRACLFETAFSENRSITSFEDEEAVKPALSPRNRGCSWRISLFLRMR